MRVLLPLLLAVLLGGCETLANLVPGAAQRRVARAYTPTQPRPTAAPATPVGPTRPLRRLQVRVYADLDYSTQVLRWKEHFAEQLARASEVTREHFGVEFEVESARMWERSGSARLEDALAQLEARDTGEGVDLVVGLVTALPVFTASQHQLGMARPFGRHAVLRSMENPEEARWIVASFDELGQDEQSALYRQRKLHKEMSVFLHEWAHTLGAIHVRSRDSLLSPVYDVRQASFCTGSEALVRLGLEHHGRAQQESEVRARWEAAWRERIGSLAEADWDPGERDAALATGPAPAQVAPQVPVASQGLSASERERFNQALAHARAGRAAEARTALGELPARHAESGPVQSLACHLAVQQAPRDAGTLEVCQRATALQPEVHGGWLMLAQAQLGQGDAGGAQASALKAREQLQGAREVPRQDWAALATLLSQLSLVTWAEEAAERATPHEAAERVQAWALQRRRLVALAARSGVAPAQERTYVESVSAGLLELDRGQTGRVPARIASLKKAFPQAPGVALLECDLAASSGRRAEARTLCERVLAAAPEAIHAHFILAALEYDARRWSEAGGRLERVLALQPEHPGAWAMLGSVYARSGRTDALEALQVRYRRRFGKPLQVPGR